MLQKFKLSGHLKAFHRHFSKSFSPPKICQARKRHININFLVRLLLGHPGNVPGTNRVCPRDKVGLSQGQTQVFSLLYTVEAQFVPGTNPVCPWDIPGTKGGRKSLCVKALCAFFTAQNLREKKNPPWGSPGVATLIFFSFRESTPNMLVPTLCRADLR